jgi:hypothetical protein
VTIDLDTTDVEVYGRLEQGMAFIHQGQWVGRPHISARAETANVLAADLMSGKDDPRPHPADLLDRALAALPAAVRSGKIRCVLTPATSPATSTDGRLLGHGLAMIVTL